MKQNKILSAAILAALAGGSGISQAGTFVMTAPVTTTPSVAMELFDEGDNNELPASGDFVTKYTVSQNINTDFYVTYTLSTGQWQADANDTLQLSSSNLTTSNATTTVSIVQLENQSVKYLVQAGANALNLNDVLDFKFKIEGLEELANGGTQVRLDTTLGVAAAPDTLVDTAGTVNLLQSTAGASVTFDAGTTTTEIDVAEGATKFANGVSDTAASLGTVMIKESSPQPVRLDLSTGWTFTDTSAGATGGTLKIEPGPFAASLTHDPNASEPVNLVFIDVAGSKCVFETGDIPADEVTEESASWDFDSTELTSISGTAKEICVLVPPDNSTVINETQDVPEALLVIEYANRTDGVQYKGRLLHIKRNGTVCTVYNVPAEGAVDIVNIRITNRSSREGTLMGSLRDADNNYIFQNADLLNGEKLAQNGTVRLTATELKTVATANGHATGTWSGRAVGTVTSDLTNMEVFGLLRNSAGGPLLNMSVGASGSGCD
jgi:hypothetical protein